MDRIQKDRYFHRQIDREIGRQIQIDTFERQGGRKRERERDLARQTEIKKDKWIARQIGRKMYRQVKRKMNIQVDRWIQIDIKNRQRGR